MAIGQQLLTPDIGWKRLDSSDNAFKFYGYSWVIDNNAGIKYVNNSLKACNAYGDKVTILFSGTKFRLIGNLWSNASPSINISIDGVSKGSISQYGNSQLHRVISYEILDLPNTPHIIELSQGNSGGYFYLDAIDVDVDSVVINSFEYITKTSVSQMNTGDRISCEYTALSNSHGTYANLGKATKPEIPLNGSATPDGTFYFKMVGYDLQGRMKLVADRNIQHSISWDTLNTAGVASGSGLPITIDSKDGFTVRLMSGGVSSTDKDNEWDKIIVEGTLGGTITAGDNTAWNWSGIYSVTPTRGTGSNVNHISYRGNLSVDRNDYGPTGTVDQGGGFRPVLLVSDVIEKYLLVKDNLIYNLLFEQLGSYPSDITEDLFSTKGFDSIDLNVMNQINNTISIIQWTSDKTVASKKIVSYGTPKPRFISSSDSSLDTIQCINSMTITSNATGGSKLNLVFSNDNGKSWKTFNGSDWVNVNTLDIVDVKNNGIDASLISTIKKTQWDGLISVAKSIRIGYYLEPVSGSAVDNVDKIIFNIDMKGKWGMSMPGVDYRYDYATSNSLLVSIFSSGDFKINY